ncbi:MAG: tRNA (adenosine(37)-N6)-threonylcarbamoyltransferase complex ATPase subunit type 1 TsaE [Sphingobacteriaceae bacterium]|nr:tRNA (adenosine(37)-N6)-threonylcarbamoyltransferase complex ATPase subunit type 1 TsaE [Sphingobacteriaceae bacterium]
MILTANTLNDLESIAQSLLNFMGNQKIIVFNGEMGAGKTTFIKTLCKALGVEDVISSPTYSIINEYALAKGCVYHFDFYRIKNIEEAFDMGYEEYFYSDDICLIEWPERVAELLPEEYIQVNVTVKENNEREFVFEKMGS